VSCVAMMLTLRMCACVFASVARHRRRQARTEIKLLQTLNEKDGSDQWCIVRFQEQFPYNGHTCLVFEHLSFNLYELLKVRVHLGVSLMRVAVACDVCDCRGVVWRFTVVWSHCLQRTHFNGVSLNLVRKFARQILKTLAFLSLPDVDVIHCDLKVRRATGSPPSTLSCRCPFCSPLSSLLS
jgi:dual specificity tyrosine-phosphorylation-regulated kinase 1